MSDGDKPSKVEHVKEGSRQLRGAIAEELANDEDHFGSDTNQLLKHHGMYQQDDRDLRKAKNADGTPKGRSHSMMVRTRIPGGKVTAEQFLAELDLCEKYGNGTVRLTSRQGFQLHGVLKKNVKATIQEINRTMLTTFAACGDVERNVMCCPAPYTNNRLHDQLQQMADSIAEHLKPRATSYFEIWLTDDEGTKTNVADFQPIDEPIYGTHYLPRKFKTALAFSEDNSVDLYTHDLGLMAIVENGEIVGYNVLVGGGMGVTPAKKKTFPALAKRMAYITPDQVLDVAEAVVKVQRDFGNRSDRAVARLKYLVANWGVEKFKTKVEEYYGKPLPEPHPADVTGVDDYIGWREQGDGKWFLGINVENGRILDNGDLKLKTGLRAIVEKFRMPLRVTPLQAIILCDIDPAERDTIDDMLRQHGIKRDDELSLVRRYSMACPAMPMCGLAITDSERVLPGLIDRLEAELAIYGLDAEKIAVHMTGCPNGCTRPYTPDIGLVGKARGKYSLFLGGNAWGTRLAFLYKDLVPLDEIAPMLSPLLAYYKVERQNGESFGDFCHRKGRDDLTAYAEQLAMT